MLKTVTDSGCVVITGGVLTVTTENKVTLSVTRKRRVCAVTHHANTLTIWPGLILHAAQVVPATHTHTHTRAYCITHISVAKLTK